MPEQGEGLPAPPYAPDLSSCNTSERSVTVGHTLTPALETLTHTHSDKAKEFLLSPTSLDGQLPTLLSGLNRRKKSRERVAGYPFRHLSTVGA